MQAPPLDYKPPTPTSRDTATGLIGCGGIAETHLRAYRSAGFPVSAVCDIEEERAVDRRDTYYPDASVYTDHRDLLEEANIDVVDIATMPDVRVGLIEDALGAGTHVLSQKPFVLDLDDGERLIELADRAGLALAVNQNGRWAPHWSYLREAVHDGIVGQPMSVHQQVHWDHDYIHGTPFERFEHAILYDFAIHWFDFLATVIDDRSPERVYASTARSPVQTSRPPLLGQALVEYDHAQASLVFDGNTLHGPRNRTVITGTDGTLVSDGPTLNEQDVTLVVDGERSTADLDGAWFDDGFAGTMGELLCAVEAEREPANSARDNIRSLELCFAAVAAADAGKPVRPGDVRSISPMAPTNPPTT